MKAMDYFAALIAAFILIGGGYLIGIASTQPVAASSTNNCTEIGVAGPRTVYRCQDDETGMLLFVNDAGFIVVVE